MQSNIEEKRVEAYRTAPEAIRDLYVSDDLTQLVDRLHISFNISQPFRALSEIIGDTILGFNKIADMPRLFQQKLGASADESQRMTSRLIEILAPVVTREEADASAKREGLTKLADTFSSPEGIAKQQGIDPASAENIKPIRTMEEDMNRVHGYGAYRAAEEERAEEPHSSKQDDLLQK